MMKTMKQMAPVLAGVAAAAALALAPFAAAEPCVNPDGTACAVIGPDGATGAIPGGPVGQAGPGRRQRRDPGRPVWFGRTRRCQWLRARASAAWTIPR